MMGRISEFVHHHYRHFNSAALVDAADAYVRHAYLGPVRGAPFHLVRLSPHEGGAYLLVHAGYQGSDGDFRYPDDNGTPFTLGVMSGLHATDAVVLWNTPRGGRREGA